MADRGMIPRMLSNIYRKSKALEKASNGETTVDVVRVDVHLCRDNMLSMVCVSALS